MLIAIGVDRGTRLAFRRSERRVVTQLIASLVRKIPLVDIEP